MPEKIKILLKKNKELLLIIMALLIALSYLTDTGPKELQPWDEAMYAVRAKSVIEHNAYFDQSLYSPGSLYSASHPPLFIWLTALNMKIFGESLYSIRFWSMFFGAGIIFLVFFFQQKKSIGLISAIIMASIPLFYFYSRQAQLDIIVTFFIVLGVFFWKIYEESKKESYLYLTGVALGLALMSKIIVGAFLPMIIIMYGLILIFRKGKTISQLLKEISIILIIGFVISFPWMIYMYNKHGFNFINHYFLYHILDRMTVGVEANDKALGWFFFINQICVIMSGTAVFMFFREKKLLFDKSDILLFTSAFIPLIVFSLSTTKLLTYIIIILPFLSILAGRGIETAINKNKIPYYITLISILISLWSFSQDFRNYFKAFFKQPSFNMDMFVILMIFSFIAIFLFFLRKMNIAKFFITFLLAFMVLLFILNPRKEYYVSEISTISKLFETKNIKNLVYIDSWNKSYVINPQISYYFNGIEIGLNKKKNFLFINIDSTNIYEQIEFPDSALFIIAKYYIGKNKIANKLYKKLNVETKLINNDDTYLCYRN